MIWNNTHPGIKKAHELAHKAHSGVSRKYTGEPYIFHPERVAHTVEQYFPDGQNHWAVASKTEIIQAALLHDVVEDTDINSAFIHENFGNTVGWLVDLVTTDNLWGTAPKPNRATRHALVIEHYAQKVAIADAKLIKIADINDNSTDIAIYDPAFATVWLREKLDLLAILKPDSNDLKAIPELGVLWHKTLNIVTNYLTLAKMLADARRAEKDAKKSENKA